MTPAFSFVAAAEAIAQAGASPVFCDVEGATMNATAHTVGAAVARARQAGQRVRAIVAVDLFGLCDQVAEIAGELYLSVPTVKAHVSRLFDKLRVTNRVQIAICVHDAGLV